MNMLHRFIGLISLVCDQYVQYLLTGANPLILNKIIKDNQEGKHNVTTVSLNSYKLNVQSILT
jgi:hypothetical protein